MNECERKLAIAMRDEYIAKGCTLEELGDKLEMWEQRGACLCDDEEVIRMQSVLALRRIIEVWESVG